MSDYKPPSTLPQALQEFLSAFDHRHPNMNIEDIRDIAATADKIRIAAILAQYPIEGRERQ